MPLAAKAEGPGHPGPSGASVFRGLSIKGKGCAPGRHILPPAGGPVYALALDFQPRAPLPLNHHAPCAGAHEQLRPQGRLDHLGSHHQTARSGGALQTDGLWIGTLEQQKGESARGERPRL
jgi:hypothetical protein